MKCTNRFKKIFALILTMIVAAASLCGCSFSYGETENEYDVLAASSAFKTGQSDSGNVSFFGDSYCVGGEENTEDERLKGTYVHYAGMFDVTNGNVLFAKNIYERAYPASTTKVLTALIAIKYGNLDDVVTVSADAMSNVTWDSSVCGLSIGDQLSLRDLLYGLMLESGNDAACVIAEHISGSQSAFADLMNSEAAALGCTGSHFVTANGLHDSEHYTTPYDLYMIFSEALKYEEFVNVISTANYTSTYTSYDGTTATHEWKNTNKYLSGSRDVPDGITMIGGKTGKTSKSGYCLITYSVTDSGKDIICVVMGGTSYKRVYNFMSGMLTYYAE